MPKPIHYRHPKLGYHACGMGDINKVKMTDSLEDVTCKRCKNTVTGAIGRPKGYTLSGEPPMHKITTSLFLPEDLKDWLDQQPNKAKTIRDALRAWKDQG